MRLIVGCPVYQRNWILPAWYRHVMASIAGLDLELTFVFVVPKHDLPTRQLLWDLVSPSLYIIEDDEDHADKQHSWDPEDFHRMVRLRNTLLNKVRELSPDYFLSLDSDLLIESQTVPAMLAAIKDYPAVGLVTSMCRQIWCESWMYYAPTHDTFVRVGEKRLEGVWSVDAIMAGKMMDSSAYKVDYQWDSQGEDLGWNRAMNTLNYSRAIAGSAKARHVMFPDDLEAPPVNFW